MLWTRAQSDAARQHSYEPCRNLPAFYSTKNDHRNGVHYCANAATYHTAALVQLACNTSINLPNERFLLKRYRPPGNTRQADNEKNAQSPSLTRTYKVSTTNAKVRPTHSRWKSEWQERYHLLLSGLYYAAGTKMYWNEYRIVQSICIHCTTIIFSKLRKRIFSVINFFTSKTPIWL